MQQQIEIPSTEWVRTNGGKSPRGRKSQDGQEQTINLTPLKKSIGNLVDLYVKKKWADDELSGAIKAVAEKSGLLSSAIRALAKARAGENFKEEKCEVEQLSMIFDEVGES